MVAIKVLFAFAQTFLLLDLCVCVNKWEAEGKTDDNWVKDHQALLKQTADHKSDIKVVFLGDSITAHWLIEGKDLWTKAYVPLGAYNYGIGGDTTQNIIWRIQNKEFDGLNPKVAVLMMGTNNLNTLTNTSEANVAKGIKEVITELEKKLTSTKVLLLGITPRNTGAYAQKVKNVNDIIAKYDDQKTTFYLDMSSHFLDSSQSEITSLFVDGKHFTAAGYQVWHDAMNTLFTKLNS